MSLGRMFRLERELGLNVTDMVWHLALGHEGTVESQVVTVRVGRRSILSKIGLV
jgi:hypothetical protein